jgi:hypothetical protein
LATYLSGKVAPSSTLWVRMERVARMRSSVDGCASRRGDARALRGASSGPSRDGGPARRTPPLREGGRGRRVT